MTGGGVVKEKVFIEKVFIVHMIGNPTDFHGNKTNFLNLVERVKKIDEVRGSSFADIVEHCIKVKQSLIESRHGVPINGVTVVMAPGMKNFAISICSGMDQFSRKVGRLLALNRLANKFGVLTMRPKKRVYYEGYLILMPPNNFLADEATKRIKIPDIREELAWLGVWDGEESGR